MKYRSVFNFNKEFLAEVRRWKRWFSNLFICENLRIT